LHIITDTTLQRRWSHFQLAEMAWAAGPCAVQYRNKEWVRDRDWAEVERMAEMARVSGQCLIINDRVDLAFELRTQGVHLGQGDADPRVAATLLGAGVIIGATVHSLTELAALDGAPIHYIGVGPVYGTTSKALALPALGLDGLAGICKASPWPVVAIGGIGVGQVEEVMGAGAYGVAVLGAFCLAAEPVAVAREMIRRMEDRT
jgi:thiamine-phosphate pyrophosphorylase